MIRIGYVFWLCCALTSASVMAAEPEEPLVGGLRLIVGVEEQSDVTVTVYNGNFAQIHEKREVVFPKGDFEVEYQDVPSGIEPSSVLVRSSRGADSLKVHEQSYRYDLLSKRALLERFIGRKLKFSRSVLEKGHFEKVLREGKLLSINPEVVQFGDEIEIEPEGIISLAYIPDELKTTPTLLWAVENKVKGKQELQVSYLTGGMSWTADYLLVLNKDETEANLSAWVTVDNNSGASFMDAKLKLVAGDVRKFQKQTSSRRMMQESMALASDGPGAPSGEPFFEYHLYDFPRRISLGLNDVKQIKLFESEKIRIKKTYSFENETLSHQSRGSQDLKADVVLGFSNNRKNNLSVPLPSGRIRVNKSDSGDVLQFLGEDAIVHTPANSQVDVNVGRAFDVIARRTQTAYRKLADRMTEVSYSVTVKNSKKETIEVILKERLRGDWLITEQSQKGERQDSMTQVYKLKLQKGAEKTVTYTARFKF
jgi:hypothetical protein